MILISFNMKAQINTETISADLGDNPIPINAVEQIPLPESCKDVAKKFQIDCLMGMINSHIKSNLIYPEDAKKIKAESRVITSFNIDEKGNIIKLEVFADNRELKKVFENEAKRIINLLPKFIPGMDKNKIVSVSIVIPIEFKLNENNINKSETKYTNTNTNTYEEKPSFEEIDETPIPISVVEQIPLFSSCEKIEKREQFKCFEEEIKKHIDNNLKYPKEAKKENLERKVHVLFDIDKEGVIINLIVKPLKKDKFDTLFEEEAKRIIKKLPKFIPGKQRNKPVVVRYVVPIIFKIKK